MQGRNTGMTNVRTAAFTSSQLDSCRIRTMLCSNPCLRGFLLGLGVVAGLGCVQSDEFVLHIFGNESCVGAEVVVDSMVRGAMDRVPAVKEDESDAAHFSVVLRHGSHRVELRNRGFASEAQEIVVPEAPEHYLHFKMRKEAADAAPPVSVPDGGS